LLFTFTAIWRLDGGFREPRRSVMGKCHKIVPDWGLSSGVPPVFRGDAVPILIAVLQRLVIRHDASSFCHNNNRRV
jgi:hypothetical protein